jgi:hypothetical protein
MRSARRCSICGGCEGEEGENIEGKKMRRYARVLWLPKNPWGVDFGDVSACWCGLSLLRAASWVKSFRSPQ